MVGVGLRTDADRRCAPRRALGPELVERRNRRPPVQGFHDNAENADLIPARCPDLTSSFAQATEERSFRMAAEV